MASKVFREKRRSKNRKGPIEGGLPDKITFPGENKQDKDASDKAPQEGKHHETPPKHGKEPGKEGKEGRKDTKDGGKDTKEYKEYKEIKDYKDAKEHDHKIIFIDENKHSFDTQSDFKLSEMPAVHPLEYRLQAIERSLAELHHFIQKDKRPDLSKSALRKGRNRARRKPTA